MTERSIYVIRCKPGQIKIGIAGNIRARLSRLRTSSPVPLFLDYAAVVDGDARKLEIAVHEALKDRRLTGEWFDVPSKRAVAIVRATASAAGYTLKDIDVGTRSDQGTGLPHIKRYIDRTGKPRCYVRNTASKKCIALPVGADTVEFKRAYRAALAALGLGLPRSWWSARVFGTNNGRADV